VVGGLQARWGVHEETEGGGIGASRKASGKRRSKMEPKKKKKGRIYLS